MERQESLQLWDGGDRLRRGYVLRGLAKVHPRSERVAVAPHRIMEIRKESEMALSDLWSCFRNSPRLVRDAAIALVACAVDLLLFWDVGASATTLVLTYHLVGYAVLVWRRRVPLSVFTVMWGQAVGAFLLFSGYRPTVGLALALYTVAAYEGRRASVMALCAMAVPVAIVGAEEYHSASPWGRLEWLAIFAILFGALYLCAWSGGRWRHNHCKFVLESRRREEAEAYVAVAAERSRIAGELHDIVAHAVTVMVLQAAGARGRLVCDPAQVDRALDNIEITGQQAMVELRRLLWLEQPGDAAAAGVSVYEPRPGVAEIDNLVEIMNSVGLAVELHKEGTPTQLDPGVDLAAYRVVQEALTIAGKQEGLGTRAFVTVAWGPAALRLTVLHRGGGQRANCADLSAGHELRGMRERVRAAAGHLRVESVPGGGFVVEATLPVTQMEVGRAVVGGGVG
jgi:signal transduction histidine kinase